MGYTLTIYYFLSQQGQKASLAMEGDGRATQAVTGEIEAEELTHPLIQVNDDGTLRPVRLEYGDVQLDTTYLRPSWQYEQLYFDAPLSFAEAWQLAKEYHQRIADKKAALQPQYEAACQAHKAAEQARRAEEKRLRQVEQEMEERRVQEKMAREEALKAWGLEHGSELLRTRIEENFEWKGLARREYVDSLLRRAGLPPGYSWGEGCYDRERPSLKEIKLMRYYRQQLPEAEVSLCWLQVDDLTPRPWKQTEPALAVDIRTPDNVRVSRVIPLSQLPLEIQDV